MECFIRDNNEFNKVFKALRKYNMLAYKKIILDILPRLRNGEDVGTRIRHTKYRVDLPCDDKFKLIHGQVHLIYQKRNHIIDLITIEPSDALLKMYSTLCQTVDGVPVTSDKDLFKLNLYRSLQKEEKK